MRVFSVPASAPFLRTVIAALVEGRLVDGFEARAHPERLAQATLYLPTRRSERMVREIFLDVLGTQAVLLPRIVALGDIDEDELAFAGDGEDFGGTGLLDIPPRLGELDYRLTLTNPAGRRPGAPDGRHGHPWRRLGRAQRAGAGSTRQILAVLAAVPADCATGVAGASAGDPENRTRGAARSPDRCGSQTPDRASRRPGDCGGLDRLDAGNRKIPERHCDASARRGGPAGTGYRSRR